MTEKSTQLVTIEPTKAYDVFTTPNGLVELLAQINRDALSIAPDLSTDKGRKAIASNAYRVAQTKTYLDNLGKEITDKLKELPKLVDANRKYARETLDALKDEVRKPLTDWETEQARIEAEKKAAEEVAKLREEIERCHELGLLMNAEFDRKRAEELAEAKRQQEERDRQIAEAAAQAAREAAEREAKEKAEAIERQAREERERAERERIAAQMAAEKAEKDRIEAEERHAREWKEAAERAERQAKEAAEAMRKRIEEEAERQAEERRKREANVAHKKKINRAALDAIIKEAGISEEQGKAVITAIISGLVPNVSINY